MTEKYREQPIVAPPISNTKPLMDEQILSSVLPKKWGAKAI